jgi:phosphoglycolate phosphatase-like HAD superfamily hydrolase
MAFPACLRHNGRMHVCLFDIDGTLISSGGAGKRALEAALRSEFGLTPATENLLLTGRTDRAILRDLFRRHALVESPANWQRLRAAYLHHLPACLKASPGMVLPGIAAFLERLRAEARVAVGLLTGNLRDGARIKLGHFDLFHHFGFGGYGDEHLDRDDVAREALAAVHERFNGSVRPEHILVVGDTPLDIRCARAIGARVAAVATGWHPAEELAAHRPDVLLTDLSDPTPLLQQWR